MRKNRHRLAQRLVKHHLLGGIGDVVGAANDVADPHVDVIGHHAQVIGRGAVGTQQHDIFDFIIRELHPSQHCIIEICASCFRHGKADCGRLPCSSAPWPPLHVALHDRYLHILPNAHQPAPRHASAPTPPSCRSSSMRVRTRSASPQSAGTNPSAASENTDPHPNLVPASACPARCPPPSRSWNAPYRCPQCAE